MKSLLILGMASLLSLPSLAETIPPAWICSAQGFDQNDLPALSYGYEHENKHQSELSAIQMCQDDGYLFCKIGPCKDFNDNDPISPTERTSL